MWKNVRLAVIDFETTGLEFENDRIIEAGVVLFENGEFVEAKNWLINPGMPIPREASDVHGIMDSDVANSPAFADAWQEIAVALRGAIPVAYNATFDQRFLQAEAKRAGRSKDAAHTPALRSDLVWIDPLVWVREIHKSEKSKKLVDVAARLGISLENAHRAADDATATGKVLLALASDMPRTYGELIRLQGQYAARQDVDNAALWRSRRGS